MSKRINIAEVTPTGYQAVLGLEKFMATTSLSHTEKELIKIRASQINQCAYCINMHTKDARKYGETEQRIYLLNAWRETTLFTESERAILALTEEMTLIAKAGVSDATYQNAESILGNQKLAEVMMAIITINAWNRIGVSTHLPF
ncbi:MAG TPA: carboxymuconolactone decarboxylase family protein [Arachidicoccus sp.]|nr:carboxymuconolactone decarboxylase family protein [Arachidicoccus sp.]